MLNKKSVDDINVKGKRVLVRCDFNVPLKDGKITDENRLVAALPTIKKLIADGGKVILCSHLGKPKGEPKPELSLAPVAVRLSELLGQDVKFAADDNVVGENAKAAVAEMKDGDVVLLQNTRYRAEGFAKQVDKWDDTTNQSLCCKEKWPETNVHSSGWKPEIQDSITITEPKNRRYANVQMIKRFFIWHQPIPHFESMRDTGNTDIDI